jgi:hypothetical protein
LKSSTFDQHFQQTLHRVRAEFERCGEIHSGFECVTDAESFDVPAHWPNRRANAAACAALRDGFRRLGVNRYLFASEACAPDDPDRGESVQVIAVERNGPRRYAFAEISRNGGTATLGPWQVNGNVPQSWLLELLEDGHSDRAPKAEIYSPPGDLIADQTAVDSVLRSIGIFFALSADRYPIGVIGLRSAVGDLLVCRVLTCPEDDFATAVDSIKQRGLELILGSEAEELFCKLERVKCVAPSPEIQETWDDLNWGDKEWAWQVLLKLPFPKP